MLDSKSGGYSILGFVSSKHSRTASKSPEIVAEIEQPADLYSAGYILDNISRKLLAQRNNISKLLNLKQQRVGQLECEVGSLASLFPVN